MVSGRRDSARQSARLPHVMMLRRNTRTLCVYGMHDPGSCRGIRPALTTTITSRSSLFLRAALSPCVPGGARSCLYTDDCGGRAEARNRIRGSLIPARMPTLLSFRRSLRGYSMCWKTTSRASRLLTGALILMSSLRSGRQLGGTREGPPSGRDSSVHE